MIFLSLGGTKTYRRLYSLIWLYFSTDFFIHDNKLSSQISCGVYDCMYTYRIFMMPKIWISAHSKRQKEVNKSIFGFILEHLPEGMNLSYYKKPEKMAQLALEKRDEMLSKIKEERASARRAQETSKFFLRLDVEKLNREYKAKEKDICGEGQSSEPPGKKVKFSIECGKEMLAKFKVDLEEVAAKMTQINDLYLKALDDALASEQKIHADYHKALSASLILEHEIAKEDIRRIIRHMGYQLPCQ